MDTFCIDSSERLSQTLFWSMHRHQFYRFDKATSLPCRIKQHHVFKDLAARGKTSVDWFFGFKLTQVAT